jgi:hypothetical protein
MSANQMNQNQTKMNTNQIREPKVVLIKSKEDADGILNNGTSSLIFKDEYADITHYISKKCKNKLKKQYRLKGIIKYFVKNFEEGETQKQNKHIEYENAVCCKPNREGAKKIIMDYEGIIGNNYYFGSYHPYGDVFIVNKNN